MPSDLDALGRDAVPDETEKPLCVLVQDDSLITKLSSINEELLSPVHPKDTIDPGDVRVRIDVYIRPTLPTPDNVIFFSEDRGVWDHKYDDAIPEHLSILSNSKLRSLTTQCMFRIRALAQSVESLRSRGVAGEVGTDITMKNDLWRGGLHPKARSFKRELQKRIYGEGTYPTSERFSVAIDHGMLAGVAPLSDAANELDSLVRMLS